MNSGKVQQRYEQMVTEQRVVLVATVGGAVDLLGLDLLTTCR